MLGVLGWFTIAMLLYSLDNLTLIVESRVFDKNYGLASNWPNFSLLWANLHSDCAIHKHKQFLFSIISTTVNNHRR